MNKRDAQNISDRIVAVLKEERIKKGISQYKLAKDTGMSKSSILYIENGKQHPTLYTIILISKYRNVEIGSIISSIEEQ
mgnify:FL=1